MNYRDRSGRQVRKDDNDEWLQPAFAQMHRVLKDRGARLSFYAWNRARSRPSLHWHRSWIGISKQPTLAQSELKADRALVLHHGVKAVNKPRTQIYETTDCR